MSAVKPVFLPPAGVRVVRESTCSYSPSADKCRSAEYGVKNRERDARDGQERPSVVHH